MSSNDNTSPASTGPQKFSYKKAAALLNDTEKNRILCLALTCLEQIKPTGDDYKLAAEQHGSTLGGFQKSYSNHMKKLRDGQCFIIEGEVIENLPAPVVKTATPKRVATPKKRKVEDAGGENGETPKKILTPRKKKVTPKAEVEDEDKVVKDEVREDSKEVEMEDVEA